jgi:hypothetical protein
LASIATTGETIVMDVLEVHFEILQDTYLGMPTFIGRAPSGSFHFLQDRLWKQIMGAMIALYGDRGRRFLLRRYCKLYRPLS